MMARRKGTSYGGLTSSTTLIIDTLFELHVRIPNCTSQEKCAQCLYSTGVRMHLETCSTS